MHGRLKLGSPDASRLRQREEKLRLYRSAMAALLEKRARGQLDREALALTGSVLGVNPDVGTCWNLRRRLLPREPGDWAGEELALLGRCLGLNPKSYGAWFHLGWLLGQGGPPGDLSTALLGKDPRNFHAWEHRRARGAADPAAEAAFAASLLRGDFSNFSAWHHRGRLLPRTPGSPLRGGGALHPQHLREELELIQSAVFTDPNDQSAWTFLRSLLARGSPPPRVIALYVNREDSTLAVTFSRPVKVGEGLQAQLDGHALGGAWRSGEGRPRPAHTWLHDLPPDLAPPSSPLHFRVTWDSDPAHHDLTLPPGENEAWWQEPIVAQELFWPEVGVSEREALEGLVQTCRELRELEPQSRGCLLTLLLLLLALDPRGHAGEARGCLEALRVADPLRRGFVADVASRVELVLGVLEVGEGPALHLPGKELTSLPLLERLVLLERLELPGNRLGGLPRGLGGLRRLQVLDVSHNEVTTLEGLPPLPRLRELRLHGNPIGHAPALAPLAACPRLALLGLAETPLAAAPSGPAHLDKLLPHVRVVLS